MLSYLLMYIHTRKSVCVCVCLEHSSFWWSACADTTALQASLWHYIKQQDYSTCSFRSTNSSPQLPKTGYQCKQLFALPPTVPNLQRMCLLLVHGAWFCWCMVHGSAGMRLVVSIVQLVCTWWWCPQWWNECPILLILHLLVKAKVTANLAHTITTVPGDISVLCL